MIITPSWNRTNDLVDEHSILQKHYQSRRHVYLEHGGIVKREKKKIKKIIRLLK